MKLILKSSMTILMILYILGSCKKDETNPAVIISISVTALPVKVDYYAGENLELSGLEVELSYDNGSNKTIPFPDFDQEGIICSPEDGTIVSDTTTKVSISHPKSGEFTTINMNLLTLSDADGNIYKSVKIGNQLWMAANLKTSKYNDGTAIPLSTDITEWNTLTAPAYCWYNNDSASNAELYGALYNWYAVETGKLCPAGWHVPSDIEWFELTDYLTAIGHSETEGEALRATYGWTEGTSGTDDYGFEALPGGCASYGAFDLGGRYAYWWTSTEYSPTLGRLRIIMDLNNLVLRDYNNKKLGFSVRCIKD